MVVVDLKQSSLDDSWLALKEVALKMVQVGLADLAVRDGNVDPGLVGKERKISSVSGARGEGLNMFTQGRQNQASAARRPTDLNIAMSQWRACAARPDRGESHGDDVVRVVSGCRVNGVWRCACCKFGSRALLEHCQVADQYRQEL